MSVRRAAIPEQRTVRQSTSPPPLRSVCFHLAVYLSLLLLFRLCYSFNGAVFYGEKKCIGGKSARTGMHVNGVGKSSRIL